jgi:hypothetical protein
MFGTPMNIPLAEITNFEESINRLVSRKLPASLPEHGSDSAADERFREMSKAAKAKIAAESTSRFERAKALLGGQASGFGRNQSPKTDRLNQVPSWEFRNRRKSFTARQLAVSVLPSPRSAELTPVAWATLWPENLSRK